MVPDYPEPPPFAVPPDRQTVTGEPPPWGNAWTPFHNDREWVDYENQGGGYVPPSHDWTSNPKQLQDDLGAK